MGNIFLPILLFVYNTFAFQNLGLTIIIISLASRIALFPIIRKQTHVSRKMNELSPKLKKLKEEFKNDQQGLYGAQMALYKEHGISPAAGCLPSVVQLVVLFGLFGALNQILAMQIPTQFFIWDMAKPDILPVTGIPFKLPGVLVIVAAVTQYFQMKYMFPTPPVVREEDKKEEKEEKADFMTEFAKTQSSMIWMFPLMFLLFGTQWPSGLALYWSVTSVVAIIQQRSMS